VNARQLSGARWEAEAELRKDVTAGAEAYSATLQGKEIESVSLQDATSVRIAEAILTEIGGYQDFTSSDLERLAAVLFRYGRDAAASRLNNCAARMRAAFLSSQALSCRSFASRHPRVPTI